MSIVAPIELEKKGARDLVTRILTRPIRMFLFEAIVLFACLFTSFIFGVFYLFYEAYPLIFQGELTQTIPWATCVSGLITNWLPQDSTVGTTAMRDWHSSQVSHWCRNCPISLLV